MALMALSSSLTFLALDSNWRYGEVPPAEPLPADYRALQQLRRLDLVNCGLRSLPSVIQVRSVQPIAEHSCSWPTPRPTPHVWSPLPVQHFTDLRTLVVSANALTPQVSPGVPDACPACNTSPAVPRCKSACLLLPCRACPRS